MIVNSIFHGHSKHIELDYHYVPEKLSLGTLKTQIVPSAHQLADLFTKPLPKTLFQNLWAKLGHLSHP